MSTEKDSPPLDDVLDFYLISTDEKGADTLLETIQSYPQYEQELRELSAFRRLGQKVSDPELTSEQEAALQARAMTIVQDLLNPLGE